jgi:hypothetical protein
MLRRLVTILLVAFASSADATVMYEYTGNPFTFVLSPYATSDFVSGSFTVNDPLPASSSVSPIPLSFSFSDGLQTLTDASVTASTFSFSTDAQGNFTGWFVQLLNGTSYGIFTGTIAGFLDQGTSLDAYATNTQARGSWTMSVIPEPSTLPLVTLGLLGIASGARLRRALESASKAGEARS